MKKGDRTRQMIIDKAAPIFNVKGVGATAMSDIMKATKLSKGSLYVHFQNKEELAFCAIKQNLDLLLGKAYASTADEISFKNKLLSLIDCFNDPLNPPIKGGCPVLNFGVEADDINPVFRSQVHKAVVDIQEAIVLIVTKGIDRGEFLKEWNARTFAIKTFAMLEGGQIICRVAQSNDSMEVIIKLIKNEIEENSL